METSTVTILRALFEHIVLFGRQDSNNKHYKCGKTGIGSAMFGVFIALLMLSMAIVVFVTIILNRRKKKWLGFSSQEDELQRLGIGR